MTARHANVRGGPRQITAALLGAALLLGACSGDELPAPGAVGITGFVGAVAADEPQAALIGRDALLQGGTATDAVVAMYFAMAVTLPSQASLGGGGVCLAYEVSTNETNVLSFPAGPPAALGPAADRPTAVPGNVRGFAALHALYGRLHWGQLLAPAENLARFGVPVSRALANDLNRVADALAAEPEVRRIFAAGDGQRDGLATGGNATGGRLVGEGETLMQPDLATALSRIRTGGANGFYTGPLATQFASAVREAGGTLTADDLAGFRPVWQQPLSVGYDDRRAYFAPLPAAGGVIAGQIWATLVRGDRWLSVPADERDAELVVAAERSFADRPRWSGVANPQELVSSATIDALIADSSAEGQPSGRVAPPRQPLTENPAAATFVAVDGRGSAVACAVTLNSLFGTGRVASGTGIILAALPGQGGRGAAMLGPMLVVAPRGREFVWAGAAAGGVTAPTALADVAARTLLADQPLGAAMAAPRLHGGSDPSFVFAEPGARAASLQRLLDRGYQVVTTERLGRVNAIVCPEGLASAPGLCRAATDPRGFGFAASTE